MNEWLTTFQVAVKVNRCVDTIRRLAESGELHGHQTKRKAPWSFTPEAIDAWVMGQDGAAVCGCQRLRLAGRRTA
jgi:Helix-turn-helix domain